MRVAESKSPESLSGFIKLKVLFSNIRHAGVVFVCLQLMTRISSDLFPPFNFMPETGGTAVAEPDERWVE